MKIKKISISKSVLRQDDGSLESKTEFSYEATPDLLNPFARDPELDNFLAKVREQDGAFKAIQEAGQEGEYRIDYDANQPLERPYTQEKRRN